MVAGGLDGDGLSMVVARRFSRNGPTRECGATRPEDSAAAVWMKVSWYNPSRYSAWPGTVAVTLYAGGDYVRTDYFRVD